MTVEITRDTILKIHSLLNAGLCRGIGEPKPGSMCVEAAINYALGRPHGDDPGCVVQSLRRLKITLNDARWSSNTARADGLRRLAVAQLGSAGVLDEKDFVTRVARMTIQTMVPLALRAAASQVSESHKSALLEYATRCEQDPSAATAWEAEAAVAAADAYNAAYAAYAAVAAADAAAYNAAVAADVAAYNAAYAAYAAVAADVAADAVAADVAAKRDEILASYAERVVQILIDMKAPGCEWLSIAPDKAALQV